MKKFERNLPALFLILVFAAGCAASVGKGVNAQGKKVYLGSVPIEKSGAYQTYLSSKHTDVDKQRYLFQRLKAAEGLQFFHDGSWYSPLDAYRGGMWLMRERYKAGQDTREFIKKYVDRSEDTGQLHLAKYPDGSVQAGSYILFNELDLLEATVKKDLKE